MSQSDQQELVTSNYKKVLSTQSGLHKRLLPLGRAEEAWPLSLLTAARKCQVGVPAKARSVSPGSAPDHPCKGHYAVDSSFACLGWKPLRSGMECSGPTNLIFKSLPSEQELPWLHWTPQATLSDCRTLRLERCHTSSSQQVQFWKPG